MPREMTADSAMSLLIHAARVSPHLRDAAVLVEQEATRLRTTIAQAIADLDGTHYVNEHGDMCAVCGAADGSWPCAAREVADDLRRAVEP